MVPVVQQQGGGMTDFLWVVSRRLPGTHTYRARYFPHEESRPVVERAVS